MNRSFLCPLRRTKQVRHIAAIFLLFLIAASGVGAQVPVTHEIPILARDGRIYVQATLGLHQSVLLQVDTGTSSSVFMQEYAPADTRVTTMETQTASGLIPCSQVPTGILLAGRDEPIAVHMFVQGVFGPFHFGRARGMLGMDVLGKFASIKFDWKHQVMILEE